MPITVNVYFHSLEELAAIKKSLTRIEGALVAVRTNEGLQMATMADLVTKVAAERTQEDSIIVLLKGLQATVEAMPATQAAIDNLAGMLDSNIVALTNAVPANAPAPVEVVTPADVVAIPDVPPVDVPPA